MTRATGGCLGRDLDEIEVLPVCVLTGLVRRLDPELPPLLVDQPNPGHADRVVDARLRLGAPRWFESASPARPQMSFTKLVSSSSGNEKTAGTQRQRVSSTFIG